MKSEQLSFPISGQDPESTPKTTAEADLGHVAVNAPTNYDPNQIGFSEVQDELGGGIRSARNGTLPERSNVESTETEHTSRIGSFDKFRGQPIKTDRQLQSYIQKLRQEKDKAMRRERPSPMPENFRRDLQL